MGLGHWALGLGEGRRRQRLHALRLSAFGFGHGPHVAPPGPHRSAPRWAGGNGARVAYSLQPAACVSRTCAQRSALLTAFVLRPSAFAVGLRYGPWSLGLGPWGRSASPAAPRASPLGLRLRSRASRGAAGPS